jgi:hypothetical protein
MRGAEWGLAGRTVGIEKVIHRLRAASPALPPATDARATAPDATRPRSSPGLRAAGGELLRAARSSPSRPSARHPAARQAASPRTDSPAAHARHCAYAAEHPLVLSGACPAFPSWAAPTRVRYASPRPSHLRGSECSAVGPQRAGTLVTRNRSNRPHPATGSMSPRTRIVVQAISSQARWHLVSGWGGRSRLGGGRRLSVGSRRRLG